MLYRYIITVGLLLGLSGSVRTQDNEENQCLVCHQVFEEDDGPSHLFPADAHAQVGLGCESCHGGDPTLEDMDEVRAHKTFVGIPGPREIPTMCASCHGDAAYMHEHNPSLPVDQLEKYRTSEHGRRLFGSGDTKVATCISCHGVHNITSATIPHSPTHPSNIPATCGTCHADAEYMAGYPIGTGQLADYKNSVHGRAVLERGDYGAPACNDCHGNHGAAPPGVNSLSAVCGVCHSLESELFMQSPHRTAFAENDFPACETCHGNHAIEKPTDAMVGTSDEAMCTMCHAEGDGTAGLPVAATIRRSIDSLLAAQSLADSMLSEARQRGMMITDEQFLKQDVDQLLIQARIAVHSLDTSAVLEKSNSGLAKADTVAVRAANLIDEYYFRRKGAAVATLIITILAIALYRKIRTLGNRRT